MMLAGVECYAQNLLQVSTDTLIQSVDTQKYSASTLIILYNRTKLNRRRLMRAIKKHKSEIIYDYNIINAIAIKIADNANITDEIAYYEKVKGVLMVERDQKVFLQ